MSLKLWSRAGLFVGVVLAGCTQSTAPLESPGPRLSTAVEVASPAVVTGGLVTMTLSVTNHEREQVTLNFNSTCQIVFVVYDRFGNQVSEAWACGAALTALTLQAGETRRQESVWKAARYDYDQNAYVPLPPGLYRVQAFVVGYGYKSPFSVVQLLG